MAKTTTSVPESTRSVKIVRVEEGRMEHSQDIIACEEPLEIRIHFGKGRARQVKSLAVTMRTPGQDAELAAGFLFTEGIIGGPKDIEEIKHVGDALAPESRENVLEVALAETLPVDFNKLNRHFYTSSSCGVCGKGSIEMIRSVSCYYPQSGAPKVSKAILPLLPERLSQKQAIFECTGGIHAAASFSPEGELLLLREDVGRHNAMDKLIGAALLRGGLPLRQQLILLSGRLSFELVQKAAMAGLPLLAAVGAPSSLAIELAADSGMTLAGFLREGRFNIYCGAERVVE